MNSPLISPQLSLFEQTGDTAYSSIEKLCAEGFASITVKLSKRMRKGWRVSWNREDGRAILTVPAVIELAPDDVKSNLLEWARLTSETKRKGRNIKLKLKELQHSVELFLDNPLDQNTIKSGKLNAEHRKIVKNVIRQNSRKMKKITVRGKYHNLDKILEDINRGYFQSALKVSVTWSSKIGGLSTHTIEHDEHGRKYDLISISRAYDFSNVPENIIGGLVYHECLHVAVPPYTKNGRRVVHGTEFKRREKEYRFYNEWVTWHKTKLRGNIRRLKIQRAMKKFRARFS